MTDRSRRRATAAGVLALLALVASACSRGEDETEAGGSETTAAPAEGDTATTTGGNGEGEGGSLLDSGGFGDIETVCQDGDASGATDVGVTDTTIQLGSFTDKGFTARPGLNEEMYDAAVAFAEWCNEHGGINGRELVIADRDAALTDYNARIVESCAEDFAMVGGGAVLDDADNGGREACGLPNIAGYVVSAAAREAGLQVQPLPNPLRRVAAGAYQRIAEEFPDAIGTYGTITSSFGSVLLVRDIAVEAAEQFGFTHVYDEEYNSAGESNWRPFVEAMRDADVQVLEFIGEPTFFAQLLEAMVAVDYRPQIMLTNANFYDSLFVENAGDIAQNTVVRAQFTPFKLAETNQATQDYLELIDRTGGKAALLGMQSMSAFLLFAQAATACGSELTRECLLEEAGSVTEWTGGGLHVPQNPAENTPGECFALLRPTADGFEIDEELTAANEGIFNCGEGNVIDVALN